MRQTGTLLLAVAILCCFSSNTRGEPITDPSQLSPNPTIIDFEMVSNFTNPLVIGGVTFTSVTASLSLLNVETPNWPVAGVEVAGQTLFPGGEPDSAILITFANPVSEFLLGWGDPNFPGNFLCAYNSIGVLQEEIAVPFGPINGVFATWVGFKRPTADITGVLVQPYVNDDYVIDNIHYNVAPGPEPSTITVDPYSDEYVIMVGNGIDGSTGKLFYIPINTGGTLGSPSYVADLGYRSGAGIADFDNDGDSDFVTGAIVERSQEGVFADFYLFENIGNGKFVQHLIASRVDAGYNSDNRIGTFAVADFNGDGFKDFVVPIYRSSHIYLFANNGNKTFTYSEILPSLLDPSDAKEGDFNEDGSMDFVVTEYFGGNVYLYEGHGNGVFTKSFLFNVAGSDRATDITAVDFNEDGHLDIIVDDFLGAGGGHLYIGNGDGSFDLTNPIKVYSRPLLGKYFTYGVDSFDFDKDGHMDLILSSYDELPVSGFVFIMKGNGNGTFQGAEKIDIEPLGSVFPVTPSGLKVVIQANIDIDPNTLNLKSEGEFVTCYIGLPDGYQVNSIDVPTVKISRINATAVNIPVESHPTGIDDYDQDGIAELMVKFGREELISLLEVGEEKLTVSGKLLDGTQFKGTDGIRVIDKGNQ